jgi:hypothetical protein
MDMTDPLVNAVAPIRRFQGVRLALAWFIPKDLGHSTH